MGYYPIFLDMSGRSCAVIGGGEVAERKVKALLEVGASVTLISPELTPHLYSLVLAGKITYLERSYRSGDLDGFEFAFVATDEKANNKQIAREGRELGVWVNAADDPEACDFILPSVLRRGLLTVAVATGGSSPALSRKIREELESYFSEAYAALAEIAAEARRELRALSLTPPAEAWREALDGEIIRLLEKGERAAAKARLLDRLGVEPCL